MTDIDWFDLPHAPAPGRPLCVLGAIPDGGAALLWLTDDGISREFAAGAFGLVLLRTGTSVYAYVNRCSHFGVPLANKLEHFRFEANESLSCNVHYARYGWNTGECLRGECAGVALVAVPVRVDEAGRVVVAGP